MVPPAGGPIDCVTNDFEMICRYANPICLRDLCQATTKELCSFTSALIFPVSQLSNTEITVKDYDPREE